VTTVLVAARRAAAARLEGVVAGSRALRLVSGPPGLPLGRQIHELRPDIVLLDLAGERIDAVLAGVGDAARTGFVVLADAPGRVVDEATRPHGLIRAVLPRDATAGEILAAIDAVAAGLVALHPEALEALEPLRRRAPMPARAEPDPVLPLTAREIEVLDMLAEGLGNKSIAARLGISTQTAKFHVASIMAKLGAGSRTEAVTIGMRRGLVVI